MVTGPSEHDVRRAATLEHRPATSSLDDVHAVLERDGAVIVDDLLSPAVVTAVNAEVERAIGEADPDAEWFNEMMKAFHGPNTRAVSGVPGISPTFAVEVMCPARLVRPGPPLLVRPLPAEPGPDPSAWAGIPGPDPPSRRVGLGGRAEARP